MGMVQTRRTTLSREQLHGMLSLAFERIRGRDLSIAVKERILTGGFVLLASLMVLVFALDIWRLKH